MPTAEECEDASPKKTSEKRQSGRLRKQTTAPASKSTSLDNWVWKGNTKGKGKTTVSTVDALDLNESDTHLMVYAAMVHHAADSFIEHGDAADSNPPNLEVQGKDDSPPELHIEYTAVESPKDRLPALDAESDAGPSSKDNPPKLKSEINLSSFTQDKGEDLHAKKAKRFKNPAACDSRELDELTCLDVSPIKATPEDEESTTKEKDEVKNKAAEKDKPNKKRKIDQVESSGPMLKWIAAANVGKPAKRARKEEKTSDIEKLLMSTKGQKPKCSETFTYKNVTYKQPSLILSRIKIAMMNSASPVKPNENVPMCASTPKTTLPLKTKLNPRNNMDNVNDSNGVAKNPRSRKESEERDASDNEMEKCRPEDDKKKAKSPMKKNTRKSTGKKNSTSSTSKVNNKAKSIDKYMDPVVLLKSSDVIQTSKNSGGKNMSSAKRSIDLHSDGNESDEDSLDVKVKSNGPFNPDTVESSSPLGIPDSDIIQSFTIDSDSDDESFASMQDTVKNLLDVLSPTSPAKKVSPRKGVSKCVSKDKSNAKKKLDDSFDSDTDNPVKSATLDSDSDSPVKSVVDKPKTAAEKFAELMGELS